MSGSVPRGPGENPNVCQPGSYSPVGKNIEHKQTRQKGCRNVTRRRGANGGRGRGRAGCGVRLGPSWRLLGQVPADRARQARRAVGAVPDGSTRRKHETVSGEGSQQQQTPTLPSLALSWGPRGAHLGVALSWGSRDASRRGSHAGAPGVRLGVALGWGPRGARLGVALTLGPPGCVSAWLSCRGPWDASR